MKENAELGPDYFRLFGSVVAYPAILGLLGVVLVAGCSTSKPPRYSGVSNTPSPPTEPAGVEPGAILITFSPQPASFAFDRGQGRVESAGEGAARAARKVLTTPNLLHPQLEAVAGVVGFVAAPFAAGYGALSAAHQKLPADKLAEAEGDLAQAMSAMAAQDHLRQLLVKSVGEKTCRHLLLPEPAPAESACDAASAVLEARTEDLRLQRTGPDDSSYALRIKARARLLRTSDGAVLSDRFYEYQSGKALFIDWTRQDGLASVARTGYRQLSEQMASELCSHLSERPVFLGAGYKNPPGRQPEPFPTLVANAASESPSKPQFVRYPPVDATPFVVFSAGAKPNLFIQKPLTKSEAIDEARSDIEYQFDGLENDRNSVVQLLACLAAVPIGLCEQAAGAVRGVWPRKIEAADARLRAAAQQAQPERSLAGGVAREVALRTSNPVALARASWSPEQARPSAFVRYATGDRTVHQNRGDSEVGGDPEIALEILVLDVGLSGKPGINSPLAFQVEAQAKLIRVRDGQVIYSFPLHYRSLERKFGDWAAHDARAFRLELERCHYQMSGAIADHLVRAGLLPPDRVPSATVARD